MRPILFPLFTMMLFAPPAVAAARPVLPAGIMKQAGTPFTQVGSSNYRKLGFNVYRASLWAPDGSYDKAKPFALQVHYTRSLSKDTVVNAVMDDVRKQQLADGATMDSWQKMLTKTLPAVKDGDEIVGLSTPGKPTRLFHNGRQIISISDRRLSDSFFNIWLGDIADHDMRAQLLNI